VTRHFYGGEGKEEETRDVLKEELDVVLIRGNGKQGGGGGQTFISSTSHTTRGRGGKGAERGPIRDYISGGGHLFIGPSGPGG